MARKIISWILIVPGAIFLVLGVGGIGAAWIYNEPLTSESTARLKEVDVELSQAQDTLAATQVELERALRIVEAAELALEKLAEQSMSADSLLENIQGTLDDRLLPELKTTRQRIDAARSALESLQSLLQGLGSLPFIGIEVPDQILTDLIDSADSLDSEIANAEDIAKQASTFVSDTSYLLGGDLTETRESLENFLAAVEEYHGKVTDWRSQVSELTEALPGWIDRASIILTVFFLWFALSQFGLILHGLSMRRGDDPLEVLHR